MKEIKRILSCARRALDDYHMLAPGDRVAVGISGGKDSLALLYAMSELRRFYPVPFTLSAITVDMGLPGMDFAPVAALCEQLSVPYYTVHTEIAKIIFDLRQESNPCSLCAKMRRGVMYEEAKRRGINKVALGHHFDDAVETFMLNLFFEGRVGCFSPVSYLSRTDLTMIRPLVYVPEKDIRYFASHVSLPVVSSTCPEDGNTERENMKQLLRTLERDNKGLRHRIFGAMEKAAVDGWGKAEPDEKPNNP